MWERIVWGLTLACLPLACSGTETDNPASPDLVSFGSSGCKKNEPVSPGPQPLVLASDYEGLQCVEWERGVDGALTVRLLNFTEGCVESWEGEASVTAGAVDLVLVNPSCVVSRCGSCLFDWRFDLANVASSVSELYVRIGSKVCPGSAAEWRLDLTLPIGSEASGIMCAYAEAWALGAYATATGRCGQKHMSCVDPCDGMPCNDGLTCAPVPEANDQRCLAPCTTDDDCSPTGLLSCVDGLCRLAADF